MFGEVHKRLRAALRDGKYIVLDAVNTIKRDEYFADIAGTGYKVVGRLLLADKELCVKRVFEREKADSNCHKVGNPSAVWDFIQNEVDTNFPTMEEGFDELIIYKNNKVVSVQKKA